MSTTERNRRNERVPAPGGGLGADDNGAGLQEMRAEIGDLLAAGDDAIERALSSDSEGFLKAARQRGGQ